jgi:hypothetical protein
MNNENFDALLQAARQEPEPQRILFVFSETELPEEHSSAEAHRFHAGQGGALNPIMYVDKTLDELNRFADLVAESQQMGQNWKIVFVGALSGRNGKLPSSQEAQAALDMMVKSVQQGAVSNFLALDRNGNQVKFV